MNLKGRNFLTLKDFTPEEIEYLIDLSAELKAKKKHTSNLEDQHNRLPQGFQNPFIVFSSIVIPNDRLASL